MCGPAYRQAEGGVPNGKRKLTVVAVLDQRPGNHNVFVIYSLTQQDWPKNL